MLTPKHIAIALICFCLVGIGGCLGWMAKGFDTAVEPEVVKDKPAERRDDGSVVAGVDTRNPPPIAKPDIKPGATIKDTVIIRVQPKPADPVSQDAVADAKPAQGVGPCKPLNLRLDVLDNPDGSTDFQVSGDGEILAATRHPGAPRFVPKQTPWTVAVTYSPDGVKGALVGRDLFKRVFVGAMAQRAETPMGDVLVTSVVLGGNF